MKPFGRILVLLPVACLCHQFGFAHKVAPTSIGAYWSGSLTAGSVVTFSGAGSSDNDTQDGGYVPRWRWDFDYQGTFVEDTNTVSSLANHVYAQGGAYTVAVRYDDNDNQAGNVYTFGVRIYEPKRYYYVKDHLGSIRSTVKGGELLVADDFSGDLSKWTVASGGGFAIEGGELSASSAGENYLVSSTGKAFTDGIITVDVKPVSSSNVDVSVIVRYQDVNNFYMVHPYGNQISLYEKLAGTFYQRQSATLPTGTMNPGTWYHEQITAEGGVLTVFWNGTQVLQWTDATPWVSGKVGFRQCVSRHVHWDNFLATTGGPGQVVVAEDYDAWGQVEEGRSVNQGMSDTRYKYTGKERDVESLYDYFGARYYDSRIGRWFSVDPHFEDYISWSPYHFAADNPIKVVELDGMDYYYTTEGKYLGQDNRETQYVYAVSNDSWSGTDGNYIVLESGLTQLVDNRGDPLLHKDFWNLAGTLYAEMGSSDWVEGASIFSVMENRADTRGTSAYDAAKRGDIYGWYKKDKINSKAASRSKKEAALKGLIRGLLDAKDYSGGAFFWQGEDFALSNWAAHEEYYMQGFKFSDNAHDLWNQGNHKSGEKAWDYKYESTGASGKTTFMRLTKEWKSANHHGGPL
jgi:RHS repeat-associated protein